MTDGKLQQIVRALYYGPVPALAVDTLGRVADYNLALEAVFGDVLSGRRYSPLQKLSQVLSSRVVEGALIPLDADHQTRTECRFDSPNLGEVHLTSTTAVCWDPLSNQRLGDIVFWDFVFPPVDDMFHERYRDMLDQQLIWDNYAWSYDRILPLMPYYQEVLDRHVAHLSASIDGPVIDLGAGTGNLAERLVIAGRSVTAVDSSRAMLEKLRSKIILKSALGTRLTVFEARAESLPMIEDQSHSGVSIQLALFDMRNPHAGLLTAVRVLRPGGCIVVTDLKRSFQLEPLLQECQRQLTCLGLYESLADDLQRVIRSNHDLAPGSRSSLRIEDVFDVLTAEGFEELKMKDSHLHQCATVTGLKPRDRSQVGSVSSST